ncbi:MAG: DHH family phosphoesterase [Clostridia bacterium]|nr:DHH family phosphoesterase [Clostridia bacterium]
MIDIKEFESIIQSAENILITAHTYPDADAICSSQLMKIIIKKQFDKDCDICVAGKIGRLLRPFCQEINTIKHTSKTYDLVICLDASDLTRIGDLKISFEKAKQTINIDHHYTNSKFATLNIVDTDASSTAEILYSICNEYYKSIMDLEIAKFAYAGIMTDTNGLMTNNINAPTYKIIADIVSTGLNVDIIKNYFFKSYSKAKLQILGRALNSLSFYNNNIAVISVRKTDFIECCASFDDTLGVVDYALNCYQIDIAIAIIEQNTNEFYISLRSKKSNVANIANKFGGGGHTNASAFQYSGKIEEIFEELINSCNDTNLTKIKLKY